MNNDMLALIDLLAKGTAVLLLGFGSVSLLRHHSAAQRSLAWLAVFGVMLALPASMLVKPLWGLPVKTLRVNAALPVGKLPLIQTMHIESTSAFAKPSVPVAHSWTLWQWLGAIYVLGIAMVLTFRLIGSWQLRMLKRDGSPLTQRLQSIVGAIKGRCEMNHRITVLISARINVPMTFGTWRPVLMLPALSGEWSEDDLSAALEHELAHIRHADAARRWLGTLVSALWWPHPLAWMASKAWKIEQERACDDAVLCAGSNAERYASQLIEAAQSVRLGGFQSAAALVMAMPAGLETRLRAVVATEVNRSGPGRGAMSLAALAGLALAMVGVFCQAQSVASPAEETRQVRVEVKFIETSDSDGTKVMAEAGLDREGAQVALPDSAIQKIFRELSGRKGVELMSAPTIVARSGQDAKVSITRELDPPRLVPKLEAMPDNHIGVQVDITPTLQSDGAIKLHLKPLIREFEGFKDRRQGEQPEPVWSETKWTGDVTLKPKDWIIYRFVPPVSTLPQPKDKEAKHRNIFMLASAEQADGAAGKPASEEKGVAAVLAAIDFKSDKVVVDPATGVTTYTGGVKATFGDNSFEAGEVRYDPKAGTLEVTKTFKIRHNGSGLSADNPTTRAVLNLKTQTLKVFGPVRTTIAK